MPRLACFPTSETSAAMKKVNQVTGSKLNGFFNSVVFYIVQNVVAGMEMREPPLLPVPPFFRGRPPAPDQLQASLSQAAKAGGGGGGQQHLPGGC